MKVVIKMYCYKILHWKLSRSNIFRHHLQFVKQVDGGSIDKHGDFYFF
jgi:hypothetical protein